MKERPILFSGPMVRALLAGTKTQTRRVVAERALNGGGDWNRHPDFVRVTRCPYGQPGDRLWVRETWAALKNPTTLRLKGAAKRSDHISYRADGELMGFDFCWRPSIFMPRWACRLELELTQVRVERLQDISEGDAKAEGVPVAFGEGLHWFQGIWDSLNAKRGFDWETNPWVWALTFKRVEAKERAA